MDIFTFSGEYLDCAKRFRSKVYEEKKSVCKMISKINGINEQNFNKLLSGQSIDRENLKCAN
jgi:hypothetical protein